MVDRAAGGLSIFGNFIKGYQEGMARDQQNRLLKAQNLMTLASQRAKEVDEATTAEGRALAWKHAQELMDEADKLVAGSGGTWKEIKKLFGKDKKTLQDPHEVLGLGNLYSYSGGAGETQQVNPQTGQLEPVGGAQTMEQPPQVSVNKDNVLVDQNKVPTILGGPQQSELPTTTRQAPLTGLQGRPIESAATAPQSLETPNLPETGKTTALPSIEQEQAKWAQAKRWGEQWGSPLPPGQVTEDESTGQGLEMVRTKPGNTEYRYNGMPITYGEYRDYAKQSAKSESDASARLQENALRMQQSVAEEAAKSQIKTKQQSDLADRYVQWSKNNGTYSQAREESLRFGTKLDDDKTWTKTYRGADGQRHQVLVDRDTGQDIGVTDHALEPTSQEQKVLSIMNTQKNSDGTPLTYAQAQQINWANEAQDETVKSAIQKAQLANQNQTLANKKQLADIRAKKDKEGAYSKADVQKAVSLMSPAARESATDGDGKFSWQLYANALHTLLVNELGIPWEQVVKAYGGDPTEQNTSVESSAKEWAKGLTKMTATKAETNTGSVYQPPKQ